MFTTVAQGTSFQDLAQVVGEMHLKPGSEIRIQMNLKGPFEWLFDVGGAELAFAPFVPDGLELVDVWGADGKGWALMRVSNGISRIAASAAAPVGIAAVPVVVLSGILAFIRARWLSIIIAGFVLATIVSFIIISVRVATETPTMLWVGVAAIVGIAALAYYSRAGPAR